MATKNKKYQEALKQIKKSAASDKKKATNKPTKKKLQKATKPVKKQAPKKLIKKTQPKKSTIQKKNKIQKKEISKPKKKKQVKIRPVMKKRKVVQNKKTSSKAVSKSLKTKKKKTKKPTIKKKAVKKPAKRKSIRKIARVKKGTKIKKTIRPKRTASKKTSSKKAPATLRINIGKGVLDQLFESTAKVKILKLFFRNTGEKFEPKEVYRRLRSSVSLLNREMKKLEKTGLLRKRKAWLEFETRQGVKKQQRLIYELDPGFSFFYELKNLILKEAIESKEELLEKVKKIGNIKLFVLCGLFVNDEASKADLLLVGDKINQKKLNNFIKDLEAEVGKEMNCAVMTTKEFNYRYDMYDRFIRDILTGKSEVLIKRIILW